MLAWAESGAEAVASKRALASDLGSIFCPGLGYGLGYGLSSVLSSILGSNLPGSVSYSNSVHFETGKTEPQPDLKPKEPQPDLKPKAVVLKRLHDCVYIELGFCCGFIM